MWFPLTYYILLASLGAYFMITWANQYANASIVSAYTVAQPDTSSFISALLVSVGGPEWAQNYGMRAPGTQDLGVFAIIAGLSILFQESAATSENVSVGGDKVGGNKVGMGKSGVNKI